MKPANTCIVQASKKFTVLVVDDDKLMRLYARTVLEKNGLVVFEAKNGHDALRSIRANSFDAILMDIRMPGIDGFTACREIRQMLPDEFLPIIVITGQNNNEAIETAFEHGATDFVTKPINWLKLKNRLLYLMNARFTANDLISTKRHRNALIDTIPDNLLRLNSDGLVLDMKSPRTGFDLGLPETLIGQSLYDFLPYDAVQQFKKGIVMVLSGQGTQDFEFSIEQSGQCFYLEVRLVLAGNHELVAVLRDFSERQQAQAKITQLAYYNKITGLPNIELIRKNITEEIAASKRMVSVTRLSLLGLDYVKSVLGRERSNQLMGMLASRLSDTANKSARTNIQRLPAVGQVGESDFTIISSDFNTRADLVDFATTLSDAMEGKFVLEGNEFKLVSRMGIAIYPDKNISENNLLEKSEMALEQAIKSKHSGPLIYCDEIGQKSVKKSRMAKELKIAIDNGDLFLNYQPKVDATTLELTGVEALVRWNMPDTGIISPAEFIPLAEESGLILSIGEFVLYEACRQSRLWSDSQLKVVPIAVNFSGHQFNQQNFVANILKTFDRYSLDNGLIEVELTESVAMGNSIRVRSILANLSELGINTAIDDFGTGYSSLSSLREFNFHTLKIDRSFVSELNIVPSASAIVRGIITMGHALNMKVVAEGVEEEHQLDFLRKNNCDTIQGYLTGRPVSSNEIQEMLMTK
ncbi:MAG: EAL domain-containing protein (putative c-di-GMP-specific phosphodiesterase class I) [Psychromonas sp.]|jgi:EAL domain-containing protein (putative c-di-GMP-specific phosphodiesterase class I)/CheY-like chemotaxis protein/GGDEF domain-containing protein